MRLTGRALPVRHLLRRRHKSVTRSAPASSDCASAGVLSKKESPEKELLERQKLDAEIRKIEREITSGRSTIVFERWRIAASYLTFAVALFGALLGGYVQLNTYFDQKGKDLAYSLSKDTNELIRALTDAKNANLQRLAALQLANFGAVAAPLLIEAIDVASDSSVTDAVVTALRFIADGRGGHEPRVDAMTPLISATKRVFNRELDERQPNPEAMRQHVRALAAMAGAQPDRTVSEKGRATLQELSAALTKSRIPQSDKDIVEKSIADGLKAMRRP